MLIGKDGKPQMMKMTRDSSGKPVVTVTKRVVKLSDLKSNASGRVPTVVSPTLGKDGKYSFTTRPAGK